MQWRTLRRFEGACQEDLSTLEKNIYFIANVIKIDAGNLSLIIRHHSKCTDQVSYDIYKNLKPKHIALTSEVSISND